MEEKRDDQKTIIDRLNQEHQYHVGLQDRHHSLREELALLQGEFNAIVGAQQHALDRIQQAQHCQEAHKQYQQAQEEQDQYVERLGRLPYIQSCYDSFVQAQTQLHNSTDTGSVNSC